jgi:YihY family inner membrane protein
VDLAAPIRATDRFQRRHAWAGFPFAVVKRFGDSGAGSLAATLAYYGFFSLFPLLMVFTSVAAIVMSGRPDLQERLLRSALAQFPVIGTEIRSNIGSIDGSLVTVVVGLALALWAGLGAVRAAQVAMDTVWDVPRKRRRGTPASIAIALAMLAVMAAFVLGSAGLAALSTAAPGAAGRVLGLAGSAVLNVVFFAIAYRVLTAAHLTWRQVLPGAGMAGLGWTVLLSVGGWLVADRVASSSDVYGTFALVIGLLAWIYLGAQLMLLGAEVNVVRTHRLWPRSLQPPLTEADERALRRSASQEERVDHEMVDVRFEGEMGQDDASEHAERDEEGTWRASTPSGRP